MNYDKITSENTFVYVGIQQKTCAVLMAFTHLLKRLKAIDTWQEGHLMDDQRCKFVLHFHSSKSLPT